MRNENIFIILIFNFFQIFGQNLVPNPSFETYTQCPTAGGQATYASGWGQVCTVDYFNSCSTNPQFGVPSNWGGSQTAASGQAYCALGVYSPDTNGTREFIGTYLISPLTIGTKYFASFKVCLSINSNIASSIASNKLGMLFSNSPLTSCPQAITNFAQVYTDSIITDTVNWTIIRGAFVANSSFNYLKIGNWFSNNNTQCIAITDTLGYPFFSYYYLDDIAVSTDSLVGYQIVPTQINANVDQSDLLKIFPNPTTNELNFNFNKYPQIKSIEIYNSQGLIVNIIENANEENIKINTTHYQKGMYFYKIIKLNDRKFAGKFIIE